MEANAVLTRAAALMIGGASGEWKQSEVCSGPLVVNTETLQLPGLLPMPFAFYEPSGKLAQWMGPNDSSISRGDREDTGDNEARPDEMGSGDAQPTGDPTSFGGTTSIRHPSSDRFDQAEELQDMDGMEVMLPTDGRLGLTDVGDVPADDWAADTGETRTAEEEPNR